MKYLTGLLSVCFCLFVFTTHTVADPVELQSANGGKLTGNLVMADGKTFSDGVVLITHGTLAHGKMNIIQYLQNNLVEAGHSVLAINLSLGAPDRDFMYDCKVTHRHKHHDAMAEIGDWVSWLKTKGAPRVSLVGHSRGANQTAWYAAESASDIVDRVALVAPSVWTAEDQAQAYQKRYGRSLSEVLARATKLVADGKGSTVMERTGVLYCSNAEVQADTFVSYYKPDERRHTPALLNRIKVPVMVVAGSEDDVVKDLAAKVEAVSPGDHVRLETIDGAGHFFRDFFEEDLTDLVTNFLGSGSS